MRPSVTGDGLKSIMWDATEGEAPQVTVCSAEAGLLIRIKPQPALERPALISGDACGLT
jgi:hypothetical protein